jgi:hypothetical protein
VSTLQMMKGPPLTMHECQTEGIHIRELGSVTAAAHAHEQLDAAEAVPTKLNSSEAADAEYARRLQAKMDASEYATQQRGCASSCAACSNSKRSAPQSYRLFAT